MFSRAGPSRYRSNCIESNSGVLQRHRFNPHFDALQECRGSVPPPAGRIGYERGPALPSSSLPKSRATTHPTASKDKSRNPAHRREPPESRKRPPPVSPRNPSGPYRSSSDISAPTTGSFSSRQGRLRLASGGSRFFVAALPRSVASCAVTAVPIASVIDSPITSTSARISSITSCRRICAGPVLKRCYDHFLAVMTPVRTRQTGRKLLYNPYFH